MMFESGLSRRDLLRRGALASVGLAVGGSALGACASSVKGSGDKSSGTKAGGGTVTLMVDQNDLINKVVAAFRTAHPEIKVTVLKYDFTRLTAMIAGGQPPDLIKGLGVYDAPYIAARGLAEPLDDYLAKATYVKAGDLKPVNDLWRFDGTTQGKGPRYGITQDYSQDAMQWVNTDLYAAAGVDPLPEDTPVTYADLLDRAKRLTRKAGNRVTTYGLGGFDDIGLGYLNQQLATTGNRLFNDDFTQVDFSTESARQILQWWIDMVQAGVSYNTRNPAPGGWDAPEYAAGRISTFMSGYWFQGTLTDTPKVQKVSKLVPAPMFGSTRVSPCYAAVGLWMAKASKNKDAAWTFMDWYMGGDPAKDRAKSGWGLSALTSLESLQPSASPQQKQIQAVQAKELAYFTVIPMTPYVKLDAFETTMKQEFKRAIDKGTAAGPLSDALNTSLNKLIAVEKAKVK